MKLNTVGRVARNSLAMSVALVIKRATHFVLYILIARHLGVEVFGQFSLAYSLFLIFEVPSRFGLGNLIVREVAKKRSEFDRYLIGGHLVGLMATIVCVGIWLLLIHLLGYSEEVIKACYLLGLALIPMVLSKICESIFRAFERMQFIVYAFALANIVQLALAWFLLQKGFGLNSIVALLVVIQWLMWLLEWVFIYRYFARPTWKFDLSFSRHLAKAATTFLGVGIFTDLFLRLNIIILGKVRGEIEVGLYNAGFQLTFIFMVISMSIATAVYPVLSRTFTANVRRFRQYAERSMELLVAIALPLAIIFFFLADAILLLYREEFVQAAPVLRILGWMIIPLSFNRILGSVLLTSGHQRANLVIALVNMGSLFVISVLLVPRFGAVGAAVALTISMTISFGQHYFFVSRRIIPVSISKVIWKPLLASSFLVAYFFLIGKTFGPLLAISVAVLLYIIVMLAVYLATGGLPAPVKAMLHGEKPRAKHESSIGQ
jgi:O-antigen/teichoic acid export membrane protein